MHRFVEERQLVVEQEKTSVLTWCNMEIERLTMIFLIQSLGLSLKMLVIMRLHLKHHIFQLQQHLSAKEMLIYFILHTRYCFCLIYILWNFYMSILIWKGSTIKTIDNFFLELFQFEKASHGSEDKVKAQKELETEISHRYHVDTSVHLIGNLLFGEEKSSTMMVYVRPPGEPLVDDWNCLKTLVSILV